MVDTPVSKPVTHFNPENDPSLQRIAPAMEGEERIIIEDDELSVIEEESDSDVSVSGTTNLNTEAMRASSFNPDSGTLLDTTSEKKFLSTDDNMLATNSENIKTDLATKSYPHYATGDDEWVESSRQVINNECHKSSQETLVQLTDLSDNLSESYKTSKAFSVTRQQQQHETEVDDYVIIPCLVQDVHSDNVHFPNELHSIETNENLHQSKDIKHGGEATRTNIQHSREAAIAIQDLLIEEPSEELMKRTTEDENLKITPSSDSSDNEQTNSLTNSEFTHLQIDDTKSDIPLELSEYSDSIESSVSMTKDHHLLVKSRNNSKASTCSARNSVNHSKNNSISSTEPFKERQSSCSMDENHNSNSNNDNNGTFSLVQQGKLNTEQTTNSNRPVHRHSRGSGAGSGGPSNNPLHSFQKSAAGSTNNSSALDSEELIHFLEKDAQRDILGEYPELPLDEESEAVRYEIEAGKCRTGAGHKTESEETKVTDDTDVKLVKTTLCDLSSNLPPKPQSRSVKSSPNNKSERSRRNSWKDSQSSSQNTSPKLSPKSSPKLISNKRTPSNSPGLSNRSTGKLFDSPRDFKRRNSSDSSASDSSLRSQNLPSDSSKLSPKDRSRSSPKGLLLSLKEHTSPSHKESKLSSEQRVTSSPKGLVLSTEDRTSSPPKKDLLFERRSSEDRPLNLKDDASSKSQVDLHKEFATSSQKGSDPLFPNKLTISPKEPGQLITSGPTKCSPKLTDCVPNSLTKINTTSSKTQNSFDNSSTPLSESASDIDEDSIESDVMFSSLKLSNDVVSADFPTDDEENSENVKVDDIGIDSDEMKCMDEIHSEVNESVQITSNNSTNQQTASAKIPYLDLSEVANKSSIHKIELSPNASETECDSKQSSTKSVRRSLKFELENTIGIKKVESDGEEQHSELSEEPIKITKPIKNMYSFTDYDVSSASDLPSDDNDAFDVTSLGTLDDTDPRLGTSPDHSEIDISEPELTTTAKKQPKSPNTAKQTSLSPGEVPVKAVVDLNISGDGDQEEATESIAESFRIFIALYSYDPLTMSPNVDFIDDELAFKKGDLIKVFDDRDEDGFYFGELNGKTGMIPGNMIAEVNTEDNSIKTDDDDEKAKTTLNKTEDSFDLTFMVNKENDENGDAEESLPVAEGFLPVVEHIGHYSISASAPSIAIGSHDNEKADAARQNADTSSQDEKSLISQSYLYASQSMPELHSDNDDHLEDGYHNDRIDPYKLPPQLMVALYDYDPAVSSPNVDSEVSRSTGV